MSSNCHCGSFIDYEATATITKVVTQLGKIPLLCKKSHHF
jgi:hypothetical protein